MATPPKPRRAKAKPKPKTKVIGRPRIVITAETREAVTRLAAVGTPQAVIARILKISIDTLERRCRAELDFGLPEANAQVAGALFSQALSGNVNACIWWEKTRAGMREIQKHEHAGPDGGPIPLKDMTGYSDEELDALERAATIFAGTASRDGAES